MSEELWKLLKIIQSASSKAMTLLGPEITEIKIEDASVKSVLTVSQACKHDCGFTKSLDLEGNVCFVCDDCGDVVS